MFPITGNLGGDGGKLDFKCDLEDRMNKKSKGRMKREKRTSIWESQRGILVIFVCSLLLEKKMNFSFHSYKRNFMKEDKDSRIYADRWIFR